MNRKEFFEMVKKEGGIFRADHLKRIQWAYWTAKAAHKLQERDNGERYFEHCRRVACLLIRYCEPKPIHPDMIIVALLHDVIEDAHPPKGYLETLFGERIVKKIQILSKWLPIYDEFDAVKTRARVNEKEYYKKISEADFIVRSVKIADRLDNLRDMNGWAEAEKLEYAAETEKYILPIAKSADEIAYQLLSEEITKIKKKGGE